MMSKATLEAIQLTETARSQLVPDGKLRAGVAIGPTKSALWSTQDPVSGRLEGVTIDLASSDDNIWTVTFAPVDEERKKLVDFGPNYFLGDSTYLVQPGSNIERC
jgi:polar amino acid transport system substrate-binding protein